MEYLIKIHRNEEGDPTGFRREPKTQEDAYVESRNQAWEEATNPLNRLSFAELLLIGTHIPESNQVIDKELARRQVEIIGAAAVQARLADPSWD
jgi:hypothetical protein